MNLRFARFGVVSAMVFFALGLWTFIPLAWVWVASHLQAGVTPSFGAYCLILAGIPVTIILLSRVLSMLDRTLDRMAGTERKRERAAWLRSMRGETDSRHEVTTLDLVMIGTLVLAGIVMAIWFFFFASMKLPG